jgi:hypothetical protein
VPAPQVLVEEKYAGDRPSVARPRPPTDPNAVRLRKDVRAGDFVLVRGGDAGPGTRRGQPSDDGVWFARVGSVAEAGHPGASTKFPVGTAWISGHHGTVTIIPLVPVGWRSGDGCRPERLAGSNLTESGVSLRVTGADICPVDFGRLPAALGAATSVTITGAAQVAFETQWWNITGSWLTLKLPALPPPRGFHN